MKIVLPRVTFKSTVYDSVLPLNAAWRYPLRFFSDILKSTTITVVDVGAAGSPPTELAPLAEHIHLVSIDANPGQMDSPDKSLTGALSNRGTSYALYPRPM